MTFSGSDGVAPPVRTKMGSLSAEEAPNNAASASDSVFDLLDGEPLDALLRDDAADWGDDAALHSALMTGFGATAGDAPGVGDSAPPPSAELVMLHPCLDAGHFPPCAMCTPAPAEGEEGAGAHLARLRPARLNEALWWCCIGADAQRLTRGASCR